MNYVENLLIYARNLSPFYIFSMVISICVVLLTAYFGFTGCSATLDRDEQSEKNENNNSSKSQTDDSADEPDSELEEESERTRRLHIESLGQLKSAKLKSIEKSLTEEQR
ncbi:AGAP012863-PA, partial [Anopheles gambiae str. PEST]